MSLEIVFGKADKYLRECADIDLPSAIYGEGSGMRIIQQTAHLCTALQKAAVFVQK